MICFVFRLLLRQTYNRLGLVSWVNALSAWEKTLLSTCYAEWQVKEYFTTKWKFCHRLVIVASFQIVQLWFFHRTPAFYIIYMDLDWAVKLQKGQQNTIKYHKNGVLHVHCFKVFCVRNRPKLKLLTKNWSPHGSFIHENELPLYFK